MFGFPPSGHCAARFPLFSQLKQTRFDVDRGFGALRFVARPSAIRTPNAPRRRRRRRAGPRTRSRCSGRLLEPASVAPRLVQDRLQSFPRRAGLAALLLIWLFLKGLANGAGEISLVLMVTYNVDGELVPVHKDERGLVQHKVSEGLLEILGIRNPNRQLFAQVGWQDGVQV